MQSLVPMPWERQEGETDMEWKAFQIYRDLPFGTPDRAPTARTPRVVSYALGYKNPANVRSWMEKNNWVERVEQYDIHMDRRQQDLNLVSRSDLQIAATQDIINRINRVNRIIDAALDAAEEELDMKAVKSLVASLKTADDLLRRALALPTTYKNEVVRKDDDANTDDTVYIVGE